MPLESFLFFPDCWNMYRLQYMEKGVNMGAKFEITVLEFKEFYTNWDSTYFI